MGVPWGFLLTGIADTGCEWGSREGHVHTVSVSSVLGHAPLPCRTSLTEPEFRDEISKIFKMATAKHETSVGPL